MFWRSLLAWIVTGSWIAFAQQAAPTRTERNLQVLYRFDEREGNSVGNQAETDDLRDLTLVDPQRVQWRRGWLHLKNETLLRSESAGKRLTAAIRQSNALTIEAWIKPANTTQAGPSRVVSLSSDVSNRNFTLGQQANTWEIRLRTSETNLNGLPGLVTKAATVRSELMHLVFTRDIDMTGKFYVDGELAAAQSMPGDFSNWNEDYSLLIGNEATADRGWLGELHLVAVYSAALTSVEVQQHFAAGPGDQIDIDRLPAPSGRSIDFVADVQPILRQHCFECHASGNEEGNLNLSIKARAIEGGEHGPVIHPGNSAASPLVHWVAGVDVDRKMPPDDQPPLTSEQIGILRAWIDQGAHWPIHADVLDPKLERARQHWAFQRLRDKVQPPELANDQWSQNSVDKFIAAKHLEHKLLPAPPLPAPALARRIYFDLVGLPPTPQQVDDFVRAHRDDPAGAVSKLVDQLLGSQHYGERWARHWLDLVRFAESDGEESDRDRPYAYRYRDFVIRAFNDDMPYDDFVRWQIAGDEIEPSNPVAVAPQPFD